MGWLHKIGCKHERMVLVSFNYCTPRITTTAIDHEIICADCGKIILDRDYYDKALEIIRAKGN